MGAVSRTKVDAFFSHKDGEKHLVHRVGAADDGFGGHAADVEAVAAHHPLLDQRHLCTHPCAACRRHQAPRPRTDHHQVVPVPGMYPYLKFSYSSSMPTALIWSPWSGEYIKVGLGIYPSQCNLLRQASSGARQLQHWRQHAGWYCRSIFHSNHFAGSRCPGTQSVLHKACRCSGKRAQPAACLWLNPAGWHDVVQELDVVFVQRLG